MKILKATWGEVTHFFRKNKSSKNATITEFLERNPDDLPVLNANIDIFNFVLKKEVNTKEYPQKVVLFLPFAFVLPPNIKMFVPEAYLYIYQIITMIAMAAYFAYIIKYVFTVYGRPFSQLKKKINNKNNYLAAIEDVKQFLIQEKIKNPKLSFYVSQQISLQRKLSLLGIERLGDFQDMAFWWASLAEFLEEYENVSYSVEYNFNKKTELYYSTNETEKLKTELFSTEAEKDIYVERQALDQKLKEIMPVRAEHVSNVLQVNATKKVHKI